MASQGHIALMLSAMLLIISVNVRQSADREVHVQVTRHKNNSRFSFHAFFHAIVNRPGYQVKVSPHLRAQLIGDQLQSVEAPKLANE
jgi:hypothetical protein